MSTNVTGSKHIVFIGRWNPLHKGHMEIMLKKQKETGCPLLILIRDSEDEIDVYTRAQIIRKWMKNNNIAGDTIIIPDIEGVYYGRGVGYNVDEIEAPDEIKSISATKIRYMIQKEDDGWKKLVDKSTVDILENYDSW